MCIVIRQFQQVLKSFTFVIIPILVLGHANNAFAIRVVLDQHTDTNAIVDDERSITQFLTKNGQTLTFAPSGQVTTSPLVSYGLGTGKGVYSIETITFAGVKAQYGLSDIGIVVNTSDPDQGIVAHRDAAIDLDDIRGTFSLDLNSGSISSINSTSLVRVADSLREIIDTGTAISVNTLGEQNLIANIQTQSGTTINGDLEFGDNVDATIVNRGEINGNVENNNKITIANRGQINGNVDFGTSVGSSFTLNGDMTGNLTSSHDSQSITLRSGRVTGDITFAGSLNLAQSSASIVGDVTSSGGGATLNLGSNAQDITGSLTLNNGDTLVITIRGDGSAGSSRVSQAAIIPAGVKLGITVGNGQYIADGSSYTVIDGGEGSSVTAIANSDINVNNTNDNMVFNVLTFTTSTNGNDLIVNASRKKASEVTNDNNAQDVYDAINGVGERASGNLRRFQQYLDEISSQAGIEKALKSITPQDEASTKLNSIAVISESVSTAEGRLDSFHISSLKSSSQGSNAVLGSKSVPSAKSGISSGDVLSSAEIWGQTFGTKAKQKNANDNGYNSTSIGFAFGADKEIDKNTRLGVSVSYADSGIVSSNNSKRTDVDTYQFNIYAGKSFDKYFVDGLLGFAWNQYHSSRSIESVSSVAQARYHGRNYIAKVRAGSIYHHIADSKFHLTPEISTTYVSSFTDSYTEEGADTLNLQVKSNSDDFLEGRIGLGISHEAIETNIVKSQELSLTPRVNLSYGYNFLNKSQITISNFAGQSSTFNTASSNVDSGSLKWGAGLDIYNQKTTTISLDYANERRGDYTSHTGFIKAKYQF